MPLNTISPKRLIIKPTQDARIAAAAEARLASHYAMLQTMGIAGLNGLGTLRIGAGQSQVVVPRPGLLRPRSGVTAPSSGGQFKRAYLWNRSTKHFELDGNLKEAAFLSSEAFPASAFSLRPNRLVQSERKLRVEDCYWAASRIEIAANTTVLFQYPNMYLTVLCDELIVGENVTFTWEFPPEPRGALRKVIPFHNRPDVLRPPTPETPRKPGEAGLPGLPGIAPGAPGHAGMDAPELELWTLKMEGTPAFFFDGQEGFPGADGCDGGRGGDGAKGRNETKNLLGFCELSAGRGGQGGKGGRAGDGAPGGAGGKGGEFFLFAPADVLQRYGASGFSVSADGGHGGRGGSPGVPGAGGSGGAPGNTTVCVPPFGYKGGPSTTGKQGDPGKPGSAGAAGPDGETRPAQFHLVPIDEAKYRRKLTDPAIHLVTPPDTTAFEGDPVKLEGERFSATDRITIDGVDVPAVFIDSKHLSFRIPSIAAGRKEIAVLRSDGARSNSATVLVGTRITSPRAGTRHRPGTILEIRGVGFSPDVKVRLNGRDMPGYEWIDVHTIRGKLERPENVTHDANGEPVELQVACSNVESAIVPLVLDTFRMVVLGDSVMWGQGLADAHKIDRLVEAGIRKLEGNIYVDRENFAHSGAIIGFAHSQIAPSSNRFSRLDGEIPTDHPTIFEQVALSNSGPETMDLVLINGGINDVNFRNVLKSTDDRQLKRRIEQHCRDNMLHLLRLVTSKFPNAKVVVSGYYPIISEDSKLDPLNITRIMQGLLGEDQGLNIASPDMLVSNCRLFAEHSELSLQAAVDAINLELANADPVNAHRVTLVVAPYKARNSVFAEEPWLFAVTSNLDLTPQDDMAQHRDEVCSVAPTDRTNRWQCARASVGHPNKAGALVYSREILGALRPITFPKDFLWGAATAAYQVEGDIENNDWHIFASNQKIRDRTRAVGAKVNLTVELEPAGKAIGHAHLPTLREDLDRACLLGMNAYRFSIEWARVEPSPGRFDNDALDYYDAALQAMHERGLKPVVTLNHLTLPDWVLTPPAETDLLSLVGLGRAVEDDPFKDSLKGWESDLTLVAFENFVEKVVTRYRDQVDTWMTMNEPAGSMIGIGYLGGLWSPGFTLEGKKAKKAYFNLLRAHVRAFDKIKEIYGDDPCQVGFAHAMMVCKPSQQGRGLLNEHARARGQFEYFVNWHMLDALITGNVDTAIEFDTGKRTIEPGINFFDLRRQNWRPRLDFLGINFYRSTYVHALEAHEAVATAHLDIGFSGGKIDPDLARQPGDAERACHLLNDIGWEVQPRGLFDIIKDIDNRFDGRLPMMITENGMPENADRNRAAYTVAHIEQLARAVDSGSRILGYLHWTLVDNFEWQEGYRPEARFGLFTTTRSSRGVERFITEGALAFQAAAMQNSTHGLAERFGRITSHGFAVSPPTQSPGALFQGTLPSGRDLTLYFFRNHADGVKRPQHLLGMMFDVSSGLWIALDSLSVRGNDISFTLQHPTQPPEQFTATLNGPRLAGNSGSGTWSATRDRFFGTWRRNEQAAEDVEPVYLHLRALEGRHEDARGKVLGGGLKASWDQAIVTFPQASTIRLQWGNGEFEGQFDNRGNIAGQLKVFAQAAQSVSWTRLPDGCDLG